LAPFYSENGRPSIDPELMIRMLLIGYCFGIRSERRLCEEVHLNLAYRWFCRLGLEGPVPDHTTFSKNRHGRFRESDLFRLVFEQVVRACMAAGLVGGEGFAVDASVLEANASRFRRIDAGESVDWNDPKLDTRAVREYLAGLDAELPADVDVGPSTTEAKAVSLTDPGSAWTTKARYRVCFAYAANYLIDLKHAIVVDVEPSPARSSQEVLSARTMLARTKERMGLWPQRLAADTAYGSGWMLGWLVARNIAPHIPVRDNSPRKDGTFARADFIFDTARNVYVCPRGKLLRSKGTRHDKGRTLRYLARILDCRPCPLKQTCCPNTQYRSVPRDVHESARDVARNLANTEGFAQSRRGRKKVEMTFAHLKCVLGITRLRLRGPTGAHDEMLLAATAQNLRRLVRRLIPQQQAAPA
jgi:transposase